MIKAYREKELKRIGALECATCASRTSVDAKAEGEEVISQSVTLSTAMCPECGRSYVSGGTTRTATKCKSEYEPSSELLIGLKVDEKI